MLNVAAFILKIASSFMYLGGAQAQSQTTHIVQPSVNEIRFSEASDQNGLCVDLGYKSAAMGSAIFTTEAIGPVITVDASGKIIGGDVVTGRRGKWVSEIICIDAVGLPTLTPTLITQPTNPGSETLFSSRSDINGVCRLHGFNQGVSGTQDYSRMGVGSVLIVDGNGNIVGGDVADGTQGQWISALICI